MKHMLVTVATLLAAVGGPLAQQNVNLGYTDTPMQPNGRWHIHDPERPQPTVVTPGAAEGLAIPPPSDAVVLVAKGRDLSEWSMMDGTPATWEIADGVAATGKGMIRTKRDFADVQLHVEFQTPATVVGDSQDRGNSGVFLMGAFEIQVLDSYQNRTYADGSAAAMYGQFPPLVNASRKPGEWQTYDIVFTAPRFKVAGELDRPAIVTVLHNGILVHHATAFYGPTQHRRIDPYSTRIFNMSRGVPRGPVALQDHGNPIHYRNVWVREIAEDQ